jgi:hypothetical protein
MLILARQHFQKDYSLNNSLYKWEIVIFEKLKFESLQRPPRILMSIVVYKKTRENIAFKYLYCLKIRKIRF